MRYASRCSGNSTRRVDFTVACAEPLVAPVFLRDRFFMVEKQRPRCPGCASGYPADEYRDACLASRPRRARGVTGALSTSANSASLFPTWKQEVNQRVAAHMRNKTAPANGTASPSEGRQAPTGHAAQVAARVAERFAHAPSYNEVLAEEARAAVRAAKAASKAAHEAQAAAQLVLEGLEAVSSAEPDWNPKIQPERLGGPVIVPTPQNPSEFLHLDEALLQETPLFTPRWEPDLPVRPVDPASTLRHHLAKAKARAKESREPVSLFPDLPFLDSPFPDADDIYTIEPAQPIYANLIQFPREMVATRKVRPRLAEGPLARSESAPQLSIFEVDPGTISTEPAAAVVDVPAAPDWMRRELTRPELMRPELPDIEPKAQPREEILEEAAPQAAQAAAMELAPMSRRLLAIVVDCALIAATFLAAAFLAAAKASQLPGPRTVELGTALALLAIGAAYQTLFFTLAKATPGMRYAGIGLSTLDGFNPSRAQRCGRLLAMLLSVLPLGLGLVWALFDDSRLTWHDRLSGTYLSKR